jgi:two-component system chemotaxis response regulator CheB
MIRVLVADDSATARALIVAILSSDMEIRVVGEATNGREAVEMASELAPDVITMDIQMPEMDGFQATQMIMTRAPRPIIIVSSTARLDDVELSLEATRAGALLVLPKPEGPTLSMGAAGQRHLLNMVKAMAHVKVVRRHAVTTASAPPPVAPPQPHRAPRPAARRSGTSKVELVAIAASTGGPAALQTILADLPSTLPVPVLVVQHIAHGFTGGLAHWLQGSTSLDVRVPTYGERAEPGTIYLAPDDQHLGIRRAADDSLRLVLDGGAPVGSFRPSATYLFRSAAEAVGASMVAVILTGMGDDGVAGLRHVWAKGGHVVAQDEASSVIYGMPREAVLAGVVHEVVSLSDIGSHIVGLTS